MENAPSKRLDSFDHGIAGCLVFATAPICMVALVLLPAPQAAGVYATAFFTAFLVWIFWPHMRDWHVWAYLALSVVLDQVVQAVVRAETDWADGLYAIYIVSFLAHLPFYFLMAGAVKQSPAQSPRQTDEGAQANRPPSAAGTQRPGDPK
jgi:hypothetical protein